MSVNGKEMNDAEYQDLLENTKQMIKRLEKQKQTLKNMPDSQAKKMVEAQTEKQLQAGLEKLALTIILTNFSFSSNKIGFLCFRSDFVDFEPAICWTEDGGWGADMGKALSYPARKVCKLQ